MSEADTFCDACRGYNNFLVNGVVRPCMACMGTGKRFEAPYLALAHVLGKLAAAEKNRDVARVERNLLLSDLWNALGNPEGERSAERLLEILRVQLGTVRDPSTPDAELIDAVLGDRPAILGKMLLGRIEGMRASLNAALLARDEAEADARRCKESMRALEDASNDLTVEKRERERASLVENLEAACEDLRKQIARENEAEMESERERASLAAKLSEVEVERDALKLSLQESKAETLRVRAMLQSDEDFRRAVGAALGEHHAFGGDILSEVAHVVGALRVKTVEHDAARRTVEEYKSKMTNVREHVAQIARENFTPFAGVDLKKAVDESVRAAVEAYKGELTAAREVIADIGRVLGARHKDGARLSDEIEALVAELRRVNFSVFADSVDAKKVSDDCAELRAKLAEAERKTNEYAGYVNTERGIAAGYRMNLDKVAQSHAALTDSIVKALGAHMVKDAPLATSVERLVASHAQESDAADRYEAAIVERDDARRAADEYKRELTSLRDYTFNIARALGIWHVDGGNMAVEVDRLRVALHDAKTELSEARGALADERKQASSAGAARILDKASESAEIGKLKEELREEAAKREAAEAELSRAKDVNLQGSSVEGVQRFAKELNDALAGLRGYLNDAVRALGDRHREGGHLGMEVSQLRNDHIELIMAHEAKKAACDKLGRENEAMRAKNRKVVEALGAEHTNVRPIHVTIEYVMRELKAHQNAAAEVVKLLGEDRCRVTIRETVEDLIAERDKALEKQKEAEERLAEYKSIETCGGVIRDAKVLAEKLIKKGVIDHDRSDLEARFVALFCAMEDHSKEPCPPCPRAPTMSEENDAYVYLLDFIDARDKERQGPDGHARRHEAYERLIEEGERLKAARDARDGASPPVAEARVIEAEKQAAYDALRTHGEARWAAQTNGYPVNYESSEDAMTELAIKIHLAETARARKKDAEKKP